MIQDAVGVALEVQEGSYEDIRANNGQDKVLRALAASRGIFSCHPSWWSAQDPTEYVFACC